jgi:hypothetical protein
MTRTADDYRRLAAELEKDLDDLTRIAATNTRAHERIQVGSTDELDYIALAYTIHSVYGVIENYCLRIAKFFENGLDGDSWHRSLLHRMTISIPGLRPALLTSEQMEMIDELRAFRHFVRHAYARPIDPDRLLRVQSRVSLALEAVREAHTHFVDELRAILKGIASDG